MDGDGARDLSAAPVQHRPRRPTPTSADTDRTPSLHFGFSCVKKKGREESIRQNKREGPCTDQAVSWNGYSVVFRFPRATGKVRPALRSIKSCGFPIDGSNCSFFSYSPCLLLAVGALLVSPSGVFVPPPSPLAPSSLDPPLSCGEYHRSTEMPSKRYKLESNGYFCSWNSKSNTPYSFSHLLYRIRTLPFTTSWRRYVIASSFIRKAFTDTGV